MPSQHASAKTSPKPEVHATHLDAQVHKPHCWSITEKRLVLAVSSEIQNTGRGNQSTAAFGLVEVQNLLLLQLHYASQDTGKLALSATTNCTLSRLLSQ